MKFLKSFLMFVLFKSNFRNSNSVLILFRGLLKEELERLNKYEVMSQNRK